MWHMYQLDELLYQSFNMSDKDKNRLYRWIFATSMQWMNRSCIFFNLHTPHEMTQQRTLLFAENFTTHQEFRLPETTIRGMSIQIFLFLLLIWYMYICLYVYICIYVHICTVCQRTSFTYSKLWYLRYLTFWPEHHWEQRKLKLSAKHLKNITSPATMSLTEPIFVPHV